jgi:ribosomal-protein-alanine N-acetyltransferase
MSLHTPSLRTARLALRPFTARDEEDVFALQSDRFVLRYWDSAPWTERSQAKRFIANCVRMEEDGRGVRLAVEQAGDGAFLGWCCLIDWNTDFRSATLGYCFARASWGRGFATEAAGALLRWAFEGQELHRIEAETDTRNGPSARVLEKLGFSREGTLRENCIVDGDVSSSWVYGLLGREWAARAS